MKNEPLNKDALKAANVAYKDWAFNRGQGDDPMENAIRAYLNKIPQIPGVDPWYGETQKTMYNKMLQSGFEEQHVVLVSRCWPEFVNFLHEARNAPYQDACDNVSVLVAAMINTLVANLSGVNKEQCAEVADSILRTTSSIIEDSLDAKFPAKPKLILTS